MSFSDTRNSESVVGTSQKPGFFEYMFLFVLIIYGGRAITFVEDLSLPTNPIGTLFPVLLCIVLAIKWKIVFKKQFYILIAGLCFYFVLVSAKYNDFRPTIFLIYFLHFFVAYSVITALKFNLFKIYETLLYYLAIIGLFLWSIQVLLGGDTLFGYFGKIPAIVSFSNVTGNGLNAVVYSIQPSIMSILYQNSLPRNCGYAWEPGAFAVYLCVAIFINLFITNSGSNSKIRFWVLTAALISTQSTSGYIIYIVIILYYYFNNKLKTLLILFPLLIAALFFLSSLPFMKNKIISEFNQGNEMDMLVARSVESETGLAPGRALSFLIAWRNFRDNPVLGLGTHDKEGWTYKLGAKIGVVSGIGYILSQFGLIGVIFLIFFSIKSSFLFSKSFNYNGGILFFLIIILISISYILILLPLAMSFWLYALFEDKITIPEENSELVLPEMVE